MSMSDPIADMLTRIRNAVKAKMPKVDIPGAKIKIEIAKVLESEGFIKNYKFTNDNRQGVLHLYLKYGEGRSNVILAIQRISKPGRRVYVKARDVKHVLSGMGISILSTSIGIITDKRARKENIGGEILCNVW